MESVVLNNVWYVVDFCVIVIFLLFTLGNGKRGIYNCFMPLVVIVGAVVVGIAFSALLTEPVYKIVYPIVEENVLENFDKQADAIAAEVDTPLSILTENVNKLTDSLGLGKTLEENPDYSSLQLIEMARDKVIEKTKTATRTGVHWVLFGLITAIGLFFATKAKNMLGKVFDFSIIGWANHLVGALYGALLFFILFYVVCRLCQRLGSGAAASYVNGSALVQWILTKLGHLLPH